MAAKKRIEMTDAMAKEMARDTFKSGGSGAPYANRNFMYRIENLPPKDRVKFMKIYIAAYTKALIDAPLKESFDHTEVDESFLTEKAKSEIQQQAAGAALAAKRGEIPVSDLTGASKRMYDDMTEDQLEDFAGTKHDEVPHKVEEESSVFESIRNRYAYILGNSDSFPRLNEAVRSTAKAWDDIDSMIGLGSLNEEESYDEFFKQAANKFGIDPDSIDELPDDKKKEFFNYIDKNWNSDSEFGPDGPVDDE